MASSMQDYNQIPIRNHQEPSLVEYDLEHLPRNMTKESLKRICESYHVVSITIDTDNITGNCKGTGRIVVRASGNKEKDLQRLQFDLADHDIVLKIHKENLGKKSNYADVSGIEWNDPHVSKSQHGNSRFDLRDSYNKAPLDESFMANIQWQRTKNPKSEFR